MIISYFLFFSNEYPVTNWLHWLPDTDFSAQLIDYLANRFSPRKKTPQFPLDHKSERLICHHAENF